MKKRPYVPSRNLAGFLASKRGKTERDYHKSTSTTTPEPIKKSLLIEHPLDRFLQKIEKIKKDFKSKLFIELHNTDCSNLVEYLSSEFDNSISEILQEKDFPSR